MEINILIQKKNKPEKFPFVAIPNLNVSAVQWSAKYFLALNFSIFQKNTVEQQQQDRQ